MPPPTAIHGSERSAPAADAISRSRSTVRRRLARSPPGTRVGSAGSLVEHRRQVASGVAVHADQCMTGRADDVVVRGSRQAVAKDDASGRGSVGVVAWHDGVVKAAIRCGVASGGDHLVRDSIHIRRRVDTNCCGAIERSPRASQVRQRFPRLAAFRAADGARRLGRRAMPGARPGRRARWSLSVARGSSGSAGRSPRRHRWPEQPAWLRARRRGPAIRPRESALHRPLRSTRPACGPFARRRSRRDRRRPIQDARQGRRRPWTCHSPTVRRARSSGRQRQTWTGSRA